MCGAEFEFKKGVSLMWSEAAAAPSDGLLIADCRVVISAHRVRPVESGQDPWNSLFQQEAPVHYFVFPVVCARWAGDHRGGARSLKLTKKSQKKTTAMEVSMTKKMMPTKIYFTRSRKESRRRSRLASRSWMWLLLEAPSRPSHYSVCYTIKQYFIDTTE
jgi:hypothetical protein